MRNPKLRFPLAFLGLLLMLAGCRSEGPAAGSVTLAATPGLGRLQPLDEEHAAAFRAAFDGAKDHDRYVVALSPT